MSPPAIRLIERLPDFRNQGVWLRLLLAANGLMLCTALAGERVPARWGTAVAELAALVEPALLLTLSLLFVLAPRLQRLSPRLGVPAVMALAAVAIAAVDAGMVQLFGGSIDVRAPLGAAAATACLLYWLDLRARAHAPALAEARLAALTARIRPHFFFNSLNAVLGILRDEPRRAEAALEELAELFRAVMRDNRELVLLSDEIALARKYLDIERLRLGDRLRVTWEIAGCPPDALAPPLLLQPLLENAVHHGIERAADGGEIRVRITATREGVRVEIENPWHGEGAHKQGNRMALENLRERLMLFYDLEARLDSEIVADRYCVVVALPLRSAA